MKKKLVLPLVALALALAAAFHAVQASEENNPCERYTEETPCAAALLEDVPTEDKYCVTETAKCSVKLETYPGTTFIINTCKGTRTKPHNLNKGTVEWFVEGCEAIPQKGSGLKASFKILTPTLEGKVTFQQLEPCYCVTCCGSVPFNSVTDAFQAVEVVLVEVEAKGKTKNSETESPGPDETLFLAQNHLDHTRDPEEIPGDTLATLDPDIEPNDDQKWFGKGVEHVHPKESQLENVKEHELYQFGYGCSHSQKQIIVALEGADVQAIDISTGSLAVYPKEEEDKPYLVFANENFSKKLEKPTPPDHTQCYRIDHTEAVLDPRTDEMGKLNIKFETHGDADAELKLTGHDGKARIYVNGTEYPGGYKNFEGYWKNADIRVEGLAAPEEPGECDLKAILKTRDEDEDEVDFLKLKIVPLDIQCVLHLDPGDNHEICDKNNVIAVNDNDSDHNDQIDLTQKPINNDDEDLAHALIQHPGVAPEETKYGYVSLHIPSNLIGYEFRDKSGKTYQHECHIPLEELPKDIFLEGIEPSQEDLDTIVSVELILQSGVVCRDQIRYTVQQTDLDIDSDNDDRFANPERSFEDEDAIEFIDDKEQFPGKYIIANDGDSDHDNVPDFVPDFADGYDKFSGDGSSDGLQSQPFTPLILQLSPGGSANLRAFPRMLT